MSAPVRTGIGYDSHRLEAGRRLVLGGVEIEESDTGLAGHSDADVLTHAIIDALLGAAGLGDIGRHFPDTDARWKDASSLDLLRRVRELLIAERYDITNVDATVACESPKLGPYRDEMRTRLAEAAGVEPTAVNVKFTTGERMGFVGRGEGVAALATASVVR
ncbi:MAG TPA: 2-C-methyl-D-erythritol 2,4-cyclodiphosphate synthase [Solirubrobacteraceae bacterium]|jgi:2-C-methyl-D-erythritol 2,4-cyclodiphosphate synthase|nr:2-C-methyl-D-erythritol 2,4-cyclodiphosphate synthase [Solirubrobacteraceae bacterium]